MPLTSIEGRVTGPTGSESVNFLLDSGMTYSLLPLATWKHIGLAPKSTLQLRLADGTLLQRNVSECHPALPQGEGQTPVFLGEESDQALLSTVTLAMLGLVLNPFTRTLQPMKMKVFLV